MRFRHLTVLVLLASSACMGRVRPEVDPPVVGPPIILLTANGQTSLLSFKEDQDITIELRTSSNTKSCAVLHPVPFDLPLPHGKAIFKPSDALYPKAGQKVNVVVSCLSREDKGAEASLTVDHK